MDFEMFTEHEIEIFALHIIFFSLNEFFLSICMQHTDKNVPRKWFFIGIFLFFCTAGSLELPGPHQGSALDPLGAYNTNRPTAAPGNDLRSLHIVPWAGYHFHPCPHDKSGPPLLIPFQKGLQRRRFLRNNERSILLPVPETELRDSNNISIDQ